MLFRQTNITVHSINDSVNVVAFNDINVHHKEWWRKWKILTQDFIFKSLTQVVYFPTQTIDIDFHAPVFRDSFLIPNCSACSAVSVCL